MVNMFWFTRHLQMDCS